MANAREDLELIYVLRSLRLSAARLMVTVVCFWAGFGAAASTIQEIYSFPLTPDVRSSLVEGGDGAFYGTTLGGGANGLGSVFRVTTNGDFSTLVSFDGTNGAEPSETLLKGGDGAFYGTTTGGGSNDFGTVFRLTQAGALTTLVTFVTNRPNLTGLFRGSDGACYGTSYQITRWTFTNTPIYDFSIFRLSSNQLTVVASFTNGVDGQLIQANDGAFYGTTEQGGDFGLGSIFRVTTNGGYSTVFSFDGTNGSAVGAGLVQGLDGRLYGTTLLGGNNESGVLFALNTDGSVTDLVSFGDFNNDFTNEVFAKAPLIWGSDGALYGTSAGAGDWGYGGVFRVTTNGEVTMLGSFDGTNGSSPEAALVEGSDGAFYGTTYAGGIQGYGTVFRMTPTGAITSLASFAHPDAAEPTSGLVQGTNGDFYGTTWAGGTNNAGTIFRITTNGLEETLISFQAFNGHPVGPSRLTEGPDGYFYGTTQNGDTNGFGTVFRMTANGGVTTIATFDGTNSSHPSGGPSGRLLCGQDGAFYGTTESGEQILTTSGWVHSEATVFRVTTNGEITTVAQFFGTNGSYPNGDLVQDSDGNLYGTTRLGGDGMTNGQGGTVFRVTTNGDLTMILAFNGTNGAEPFGGLVQGDDGAFYGTTLQGGEFNAGTIFRITANGELTTLVDFSGTNGARPICGLIAGPDGAFYGTTTFSYNGAGTLFRITTNGIFETLASFDDSTGESPEGRLFPGQDGMLYGTAAGGGSHGGGTVFRLDLAAQLLPLIPAGKAWIIRFSGIPDQSYEVLRAAGLSGPWETLTNLTSGNDGQGQFTDSNPPAAGAFYRVSYP